MCERPFNKSESENQLLISKIVTNTTDSSNLNISALVRQKDQSYSGR